MEKESSRMGVTKFDKTLDQLFEKISTPEEAKKILQENYEIINKAQKRVARYKMMKKERQFVIVYHMAKEKFLQLNNSEAGTFYHLISLLQWDKQGTLYRNGKRMNLEVICEITGLSDRHLRTMLNRFVEVELLIKKGGKKNQEYILNPIHVDMGKTKQKTPFTKIYKMPGRYLNEKITKKDMGFLFKLSLFIDYNTLKLAHNPYEKNPEKIVPLQISDITNIIGGSLQTTKAYLNRLLDAGFLYREKHTGSPKAMWCYYIHPQVAFRGNDESEDYNRIVSELQDLYKRMFWEKRSPELQYKNKESSQFWKDSKL